MSVDGRDTHAQRHPRRATLTLAVAEFRGRWSEPVAPPGAHLVRAWPLYSAPQRGALAPCRAQVSDPPSLGAPGGAPSVPAPFPRPPGAVPPYASSRWSLPRCSPGGLPPPAAGLAAAA